MSRLGNCMRYEDPSTGSKITPIHASVQDLKNGKWCVSEAHGQPGTISNVKMSKTGKHGHAKFTFNIFYPFTGQTSQEMFPGHTHLRRPEVAKKEWMVSFAEEDGNVTCMDDNGIECFAYMNRDFVHKGVAIGEDFYTKLDEAVENDQDFYVSIMEGPVRDKKGDYMIRQIEKFQAKDAEN